VNEAKLKAMSLKTLMDEGDKYLDYALSGEKTWGRWVYCPEKLTLTFDNYYEIDLEKMRNSAQVLDALMQVAQKSDLVFRQQDKGDFLEAIEELLNPQQYACGSGKSRTFNARRVLQRNRR